MKILPILAALTSVTIALPGCTALQQEPVVDMRGVNQAQFERDLSDCRNYADAADGTRAVITGVATGAVIGGAAGAILSDSDAAKRGAGAGAVAGGVSGALRSAERRQRIMFRCLRGRGYRVLG